MGSQRGRPLGLAPQVAQVQAGAQERGRPPGTVAAKRPADNLEGYDEDTHSFLGPDNVSRRNRAIDEAIYYGLVDGDVGDRQATKKALNATGLHRQRWTTDEAYRLKAAR